MTDDQLNRIAGLFAGMQTAFVHLGNVLDNKGVVSREVLANSFKETAAGIPSGANNQEVISLVLAQIAAGLRGPQEDPALVRRHFFRMIEGGKIDPEQS